MSKKALSETQERALNRCRCGERIFVENGEEGLAYFFEADSKALNRRTVEALLKQDLIKPEDKGLIDGAPQSYTAQA